MIENRLAVAQQLGEVSRIMEHMADDLYDMERCTPEFEEKLRKILRKRHVILRQVWMMDRQQKQKTDISHYESQKRAMYFHDRNCTAFV